jgi:hypothetical protein
MREIREAIVKLDTMIEAIEKGIKSVSAHGMPVSSRDTDVLELAKAVRTIARALTDQRSMYI